MSLQNPLFNLHLKPLSQPFCPNHSSSHLWCNFCKDNHDIDTHKVFMLAKECLHSKKPMHTIATLDWANNDEVFTITTRIQTFLFRSKSNMPQNRKANTIVQSKNATSSSRTRNSTTSTQKQQINNVARPSKISFPASNYRTSPPYNIVNELVSIKANMNKFDALRSLEHQENLNKALVFISHPRNSSLLGLSKQMLYPFKKRNRQ